MTCWKIRRKLPGYLDGALPNGEHSPVREHLEYCADCRRELERYRKLSMLMSRFGRAVPPAELALRIRVAVAQARASQGWAYRLNRVKIRTSLILQNILQPLAVPATGGLVAAMLVFTVMSHMVAWGVPLGAVPNDLPTNLLQPARLESLAPFPVSGPLENDDTGLAGPHALLVEATVNAQGEVVNYQILSGPADLATRRQLDQVLLFSRFRPQMSFGRPTPGGRVVLSFSEIRVKG
ncbi:MAG: zf-HC2 domain-containing protein [Acidobacteria bacterium]|nr:zf-HC2 domain-containing protein [Acidobacteriota bacterium]